MEVIKVREFVLFCFLFRWLWRAAWNAVLTSPRRVSQVYLDGGPETADSVRMLTDEVSQIQEVRHGGGGG